MTERGSMVGPPAKEQTLSSILSTDYKNTLNQRQYLCRPSMRGKSLQQVEQVGRKCLRRVNQVVFYWDNRNPEAMNDLDSHTGSEDTEAFLRIQKLLKSRRDKCLSMYNHNSKPEDADVTSSIYIQILAIEFLMATLSLLCVVTSLILEFSEVHTSDVKAKHLIFILTFIHILSVLMETNCRLKWMMEKRAQASPWKEYVFALVECLLLVPIPNLWLMGEIHFFNYTTLAYEPIPVDSLLTVYLLMRSAYIIKFLIHSESYYGSRPDRLSRYYAVKISNFNTIRFLVNEKPFRSLMTIALVSMLLLPLAIYILEGPINPMFQDYFSCLYFFIVSQSTVGYGEMCAVTLLGRMISIFMVIIGLFFTSLVLIFIVAELELTTNQEDTHYLLGRLETQLKMKKAIVKRLKEGFYVRKGLFQPEERKKRLEQLAIMRIQNRRMIYTSMTTQPANMKRMIMKNFSELHHLIKEFSDRHEFLNEFSSVMMEKPQEKKRFKLKKQENVTNLYNLLMSKEGEEPSMED